MLEKQRELESLWSQFSSQRKMFGSVCDSSSTHLYSFLLISTHPYSSLLISTHLYSSLLISTHLYSSLLISTHLYSLLISAEAGLPSRAPPQPQRAGARLATGTSQLDTAPPPPPVKGFLELGTMKRCEATPPAAAALDCGGIRGIQKPKVRRT